MNWGTLLLSVGNAIMIFMGIGWLAFWWKAFRDLDREDDHELMELESRRRDQKDSQKSE